MPTFGAGFVVEKHGGYRLTEEAARLLTYLGAPAHLLAYEADALG